MITEVLSIAKSWKQTKVDLTVVYPSTGISLSSKGECAIKPCKDMNEQTCRLLNGNKKPKSWIECDSTCFSLCKEKQ